MLFTAQSNVSSLPTRSSDFTANAYNWPKKTVNSFEDAGEIGIEKNVKLHVLSISKSPSAYFAFSKSNLLVFLIICSRLETVKEVYSRSFNISEKVRNFFRARPPKHRQQITITKATFHVDRLYANLLRFRVLSTICF